MVGLGTAGAASALFLARQGYRVKVFEKAREGGTSVLGAGIGLQPIGLTVLRRLGLLDSILEHGHRVDRLHGVTSHGKPVLDLNYGDFHADVHGVGLNRSVLFCELADAAAAHPNVEVCYEADIVDAHIAGTETESPRPGSWLVDSQSPQQPDGPFDCVIFADGRSSIRRKFPVAASETWNKFGCLWALLPDQPARSPARTSSRKSTMGAA